MATRGSISIIKNGKCYTTYTHWDSYLSHKGRMLLTYYNSEEAASGIIDLGNSSTISERIDSLPNGWDFDNKPSFLSKDYDEYGKYSLFYERDRGETGQEARIYPTWEAAMKAGESEEYNYLWKDNKWWVQYDERGLLELTQELIATDK